MEVDRFRFRDGESMTDDLILERTDFLKYQREGMSLA